MRSEAKSRSESPKLFINFLLCLIIPLFFFLLIEFMQRGMHETFVFISGHTREASVNYLLLTAFTAPAILFKRAHFAAILLGLPWGILGIISAYLLRFRGVPLIWSDFYTADEGLAMAKQYMTADIVIKTGVAVLIGIIALIICFKIKFKKYQVSLIKRIGVLVFLIAVSFLGRNYLKQYIPSQSGAWDIASVYTKGGFIDSFSESYLAIFRKPPENYSRKTVESIAAYLNADREEKNGESPNIIMLQTEGLFDPTILQEVKFNEDPIPRFRECFRQGHSGHLQVPTFGGGTVRTEFEVLSGINLDYLAPGEIPYNSGIISKGPVETIAYILKEKGYKTTAIHNFEGNFYGRNKIFKNLGFDRFIPMETMTGLVKYRAFPEDQVLLDYVQRVLEESPERDFIFAITAGSHGPYSTALNTGNEHYVSGDIDKDKETLYQLQNYTSLIRRTDQFIGRLAEYVYSLDEPTVLVVYSDHYPQLLALKDMEDEKKYLTPYFIIDNQNKLINNVDYNIEAYQLASYVLDLVSLQGGLMNVFHQIYDKDTDYQKKMELLQYDLLFGKRYALGGQSPYQPTQAKLGVEELRITSARRQNGKVIINGTGFTESSKIFVDNHPVETELVDGHTLIGEDIGDKLRFLQVKLLGRHNASLLVSNIYIATNIS